MSCSCSWQRRCRERTCPQWRETTVTDSLEMGYQLVVADLNRDGRPDLIAVDERGTELAWYENPTWQRHVIIKDVPRTINLDVYDYDGDGIPEIAMGYHFETVPEKSIGNVLILKSGPDPRQPWTAREIDRIPTVHRLRWIDLAGDGKKVLLVAPMIGLKAVPPDYADNVPVYLYRPGEWKRELFTDQPRGILHSITPVRWQGRGEQLMTADFLGIRVFLPHGPVEISKGDPRRVPAMRQQRDQDRSSRQAPLHRRHRALARQPGRGLHRRGAHLEAPRDRRRDGQRPCARRRRPERRRPR